MENYIIITYFENSLGTNFEDVQGVSFYKVSDQKHAVDRLSNLQNLHYMHSVKVREYDPNTGTTKELEPYLDGFTVKLREIVPAEQKSLMQLQRGE